ncbi:sulfite exporter TauE/SafE family protein [Desulfurella sp.]|uniref:sulfite exporter TauE/SafE family protein n=1 Tax=Desulfurella sp. TaxID=1962857 RepID=UPI0025BB754E|nr:sulfite exporter TauE/SafE family protein [Desulfurella sp.]
MLTLILGPLIIFIFTIFLTVAGLGAAFIVIPTLYYLGIPLKEAMAIGLLLNAVSMSFASIGYIKNHLVNFKAAIPIIVFGIVFSPLGAYSTKYFSKELLLLFFVLFLLFAGTMMLFYKPKQTEQKKVNDWALGSILGVGAGYLGGLLGVGGGNFIVPGLVASGFNPKNASGTTAFIVIFLSFAGFLGHIAMGNIDIVLLSLCIAASIAGALVGSWAMTTKLSANQVKKIIAIVLYVVAIKMLWGLIK